MILLISTCNQKLSEEEFVRPVSKLIRDNYEIKHYTDKIDFSMYSKIIICGTALKDNEYLKNINSFEWLKTLNVPVLGICSGMQVIGLINSSKLEKKKEIGMVKINLVKSNHLFQEDFDAYALHGNSIDVPDGFDILAKNETCVQAIKHKKLYCYGVMFHPEVRNVNIIYNFLRL